VDVSGFVKSALFIFGPWCGEVEERGLLLDCDVRGADERVQVVEEISIDWLRLLERHYSFIADD
jgi:hypothetical protein